MIEQQIVVTTISELEGGAKPITKKTYTIYTNARVKKYPNKNVVQVASKPIFPLLPGEKQHRQYSVSAPGHAKNPERALDESRKRARARFYDIALCNGFEYFFTLTISAELLNRYDPAVIYPKVRNFLGNMVKRKGFAYVLVPEYHSLKPGETSAAIHMHGLCHLGSVEIVKAIAKNGRQLHDEHGRPIYNIVDWKWGFSTCVPIDTQYERTVNYVSKYITKSESKIFGKWYLASRNVIKLPEIIPVEAIPFNEYRDEKKLKTHIQHETQIYSGLNLLSEEYPVL